MALVQAILLLRVQPILTPHIEELIEAVTFSDWLLNEHQFFFGQNMPFLVLVLLKH
jgi:hypothetical protein